MKRSSICLAILALLALAATCSADVTVLKFEGIAPYPNGTDVFVQNFYNGGAASNGNIGPNYGVTFNADALLICLNTLENTGCSNTSRGGIGDPTSQLGALFFLTGDAVTMDVAGGFETGFSFNYTAINSPGSVSVYDGAGGTGNLLNTFSLPVTPSGPCAGYGAGFCPFFPVGVNFSGVAQSVVFAGVGNQIVFDDITFGSSTPGTAVPEAGTLSTLGTMLAAFALRFRRRK